MKTVKFTLCAILILLVVTIQLPAPTGVKTCPAAGRSAILSSSYRVGTYTIQAPEDNLDKICWGDSTVTTANAPCLLPGQTYTQPSLGNATPYNLGNVYIACVDATQHDKLRYSY